VYVDSVYNTSSSESEIELEIHHVFEVRSSQIPYSYYKGETLSSARFPFRNDQDGHMTAFNKPQSPGSWPYFYYTERLVLETRLSFIHPQT
jgi:hypothetical protein